jgi:hypothetical protein
MRYLMVYRPCRNLETGRPAGKEHAAEMGKVVEQLTNAGVLMATEALQPISQGHGSGARPGASR